MKDIRIGNDISVRWSLYKGDEAYDLTNLPVTLYLKNAYGKKEIKDYTIEGNQISWTFFGKDQKNTGKYSMVLVIREGERGMASTDYCDFVQLVSCACQVPGVDDENVQTETVELTSEVDFPPIIVDTALSESSLNPIANKAVAEKFAEVEGKMALQPDWNQSDPISKDYIKNRTHGIVFHGDPRKSNYNDFLKSLTNPMIMHVGGDTIATFHTGYHSLYDYDTFLFQLSWYSTTDNILDGIIPTNQSVSVGASTSVVLTFKTFGSVTEDGEFVEHYQTTISFNDSEGLNVDEVISDLCEQYCLLISEDFEIAKLDQRYIPETIARKSELLELSADLYTIRASGEAVVQSNGIALVAYKTSSKTRVSYILNDTSLHTIYGYYAEDGYETLAKELDVSNGSNSIIFTPSKEISRIGFACANAVGQSIEYAIAAPNTQQIENNTQQIENNTQQIEKLSQEIGELGEKSISYNGGNLQESNVTTYKRVFRDLTLLSGIIIKNNGVRILVAKNAQLEGRIDIESGAEKKIPFDATYLQTLNVSGDVNIDIIGIYATKEEVSAIQEGLNNCATKEELSDKVSKEDLNNLVLQGDSIADSSIGIEKVAFASSVNLLNLNDKDVAIGKYIAAPGNLLANSAYNTTGFIPVKPDATYQLLTQKGHDRKARFLVFFDDNKQSLGQILSDIYEVVIPSDARYIRISYYATLWDETLIQVTKGLDRMEAIPYALTIDKKYLPTLTDFNEDNFYLPKHIYVASGRTIELYYEQILINAHKYNIQATCPIGIALERKFQIIGNDSLLGDYELTINVFDDYANLLSTAKSTIHIVSDNIAEKSVLPIGDSLTNGKAWLTEVQNLSDNQVVFVGTRKSGTLKHEGRSGSGANSYVTDLMNYSYDNQYAGVGSSSSEFSSSAQYNKGDFCKYNNAVYIFKESHSGAWDVTKVRNLSYTNPFWNWETNVFSIAHYKSFQGLNFDAIIIFLGTNGINLEPMTNKNGALGIQTLVKDIRKEDATTPILVVNTLFRSGQNGIGRQGNTDGYSASSEYKFNADRKVLLLAKAIDTMLEGINDVYICPVGFTHDSAYNYGINKVAVNPRLTDTSEVYEIYPNESIHPQNSGYMQIADEIFSTLCAL